MKLKNLKGTSKNKCSCNSWLKHWLNTTGETSLPDYCGEKSCMEKPTDGAHVIKVDSTDKDWYIVPLCHEHNENVDEFELFSGVKLAPASVSKTCK
ncbi:hypothetical protein ACIS7S_10410 [Providencia sp. DFU6]|uniref:Uncharacterized protein n=2 Tax=Morganellaceae TaxID=1903414 RepID=A0ABD5L622_PROST|nr:hypothetical protein [Providencia sp. PROV133]